MGASASQGQGDRFWVGLGGGFDGAKLLDHETEEAAAGGVVGDFAVNLGGGEIDLGGKGDGEWRGTHRDGRWIGGRSEGG